ncbi:MAG: hypothetical protein WC204_03825, partial [Elusimicrobiales bacterium]
MRLRIIAAAGLFFAPATAAAWPSPTPAEKAADGLISDFSAALRFSELINPLPASEQKERAYFFSARKKGKIYEPRFEYAQIPAKAAGTAAALKALRLEKTPYAPFLTEARDQLLAKFTILRSRGASEFTGLCSGLYALPSAAETAAAREQLEKLGFPPPDRPAELSGREMAVELKKALKEAKLEKWRGQ